VVVGERAGDGGTARRLLPDAACALGLLLLAGFHVRAFAAGDFPISEEHDTVILQYPIHRALGEALQDGRLPWWAPETGNGLPLAAEGEAGALFPPNWALFGLFDPTTGYALSLWLSLAALGIGTFGLARRLGSNRAGAFLAGAALMLSGWSLGHQHHLSMLRTAAFLPWLLWVAESHLRRPRRTTVALGAALVGLQWLAGNPQIAHLSACILLLYLPGRTALETRTGSGPRLRASAGALGAAAAMIALGLLLAAAQIVPTAMHVADSGRAGGLSLGQAGVIGFPTRDLLLFLDPDAFGTPVNGGFRAAPGSDGLYWENLAYVGIFPLLLLPAAFLGREGRRSAWVPAALGALALLVAPGPQSGVYRALFAVVPGYDRFRVPQRALIAAALAIVLLAALGLTRLAERFGPRLRGRLPTLLAWGLAALAAYDVARFSDGYYPTLPAAEIRTPSAAARTARGSSLLAVPLTGTPDRPPGGDLRDGDFGRDVLALAPHSLNLAWNVRSPFTCLGLPSRRSEMFEEAYVNRLLAPGLSPDGVVRPGRAAAAAAGAVGAEWISSFVPLQAPGLQLHASLPVPGFRTPVLLYRNLLALPRAWLVGNAIPVRNADAALETLLARSAFDPFSEAILEWPEAAEAGSPPALGAGGPPGRATVLRADPERLEVEVDVAVGAWLLTMDAPLRGWTAEVDGRATRILPANLLARAVRVPAGRHTVVFRYEPPGRPAGLGASAIGLLLAGALAVSGLVPRRKRGRAAREPTAAGRR
jgi:hypothetical protein